MTSDLGLKMLRLMASRSKLWTYRELSERSGIPLSTVREHFMALKQDGLATYTPGRHCTIGITDKGREVIQ